MGFRVENDQVYYVFFIVEYPLQMTFQPKLFVTFLQIPTQTHYHLFSMFSSFILFYLALCYFNLSCQSYGMMS